MVINFNSGGIDDLFISSNGGDLNFESSDDLSISSNGGELISGSIDDDILASLDGNDTLFGKEGDDILAGVDGNDSLSGGAGNDTLNGGGSGFKDDTIFITADTSGIDTLTGGAGEDLFILGGKSASELENNSDSIVYYDEAGDDDLAIITDFNPTEDVIMLGASANDYSLVNLPASSELYFGNELVATLEGNTGLSLNNSYFLFPASDV